MIRDIFRRLNTPHRHRLNRYWLAFIVTLTLAASYWVAWDRTKGNQKRLDRAVMLMAGGKYEESHMLYESVLKRWPRARIALVGKGLCELNLGLYQDALESYGTILAFDPDNLQGLHGKGMSLEKLGKFDESIQCYQRIRELKPNMLMAGEQIERLRLLKDGRE